MYKSLRGPMAEELKHSHRIIESPYFAATIINFLCMFVPLGYLT